MQSEDENRFVYMMATGKIVTMLSVIEQTMNFMEEYKVKPDGNVRVALEPAIEQLQEWIK